MSRPPDFAIGSQHVKTASHRFSHTRDRILVDRHSVISAVEERVAECLSDLSEMNFAVPFRNELSESIALKSSKKAHRAIFHVDDPNAYKTWKTEMTSIRSRKEANEKEILEETRRVAAERRRRTDKYAAFLRKHNAHLW